MVFTIKMWLEVSWTESSMSKDDGEPSTVYGGFKGINRKANVREGRNLPSEWMASKAICSQANHDNDVLSPLG